MAAQLTRWTVAACILGLISGGLACQELTEGTAGPSERQLLQHFSQVLKCNRVPGILVFPYMWDPVTVNIDCGKLQPFQVYVGGTPDELRKRWLDGEQAWCSLSSMVQRKGCRLQMSPFVTTYVGVRKSINLGTVCRFEADSRWSWWMVGSFMAASVVLLAAGPLSESMALRVTSGGLLFALGSMVIITYVVCRQMPGRRGIVTTAMLLGSSSWGLLRWTTGYWLPSLYTLLHNRVVLCVLCGFGLVGAALTYLYGGVDNPKINTLVRLGLQLLGLGLLWAGTWTQPPVFAALLAAALGWRLLRWLMPLVRRFSGRRAGAERPAWKQEQQELSLPGTPLGQAYGVGGLGPSRLVPVQQSPSPYAFANGGGGSSHAPLPYSGDGASPLPLTPVHAQVYGADAAATAAAAAAEMVSPLVRAGLIINPLSGRSIKIGGDLYNRLVEQAYEPDMAAGRLLPPPPHAPGSAASSPDGVPGSPGGTARRRKQRSRVV